MAALLIILVLLLAVGALGAVIKGVLWLAAIALALVVIGAAAGYFKFRGWSKRFSD